MVARGRAPLLAIAIAIAVAAATATATATADKSHSAGRKDRFSRAAEAAKAEQDARYARSTLNLLTSSTPARRGDAIPDQYIVVFKDNVDKHTAAMHLSWLTSLFVPAAFSHNQVSPFFLQGDENSEQTMSAMTGFADEFLIARQWFIEGFKGYAARIPEIIATSLTKLPEVAYIEQDTVVTLLETQSDPPSWGLKRISSRDLPLPSNYTYPDVAGEGVDAYIVDTGVTVSHKDFEGRAHVGKSFSTDNNNRDGNGHGTHVSGTVAGSSYGVAKKANIIAVKVLNAQGSGTNSDVISGIEWVATEAPKRSKKAVANMSLGGGASKALDAALRAAIQAGVAFAVAAGNSAGDACKLSPARVKEALTVAASDNKDKLASFSERGPCVDIIAPGVDITSTWNNGKENTISGTSMASPHACGVLALALSYRDFDSVKAHKDFVINIGTRKVVSGVPRNTQNILLYADVTSEPQEPLPDLPEDPTPEPNPDDPDDDPEDPGRCPFPQCLLDPNCTSCCFEGVDC